MRGAKPRRLVAPPRRRLADCHLCARAACLDAGVCGGGELRVVRGRDGAASRVELWTEEPLEIRLVPDREEPHEGESVEPPRVARRDRAGEAREVRDAR